MIGVGVLRGCFRVLRGLWASGHKALMDKELATTAAEAGIVHLEGEWQETDFFRYLVDFLLDKPI
jgi:hypothetical protein